MNYSLRACLIFVTLSGVLAWWVQRPQTIIVRRPPDPGFGDRNYGVSAPPLPDRTEQQTFRRTNFIHLVRDGETIVRDRHGNLLQDQSWRNGRLVGCDYFFRDDDGKILSEGRTVGGRPVGTWKCWAQNEVNRHPRVWIDLGITSRAAKDASLGRDFEASLEKSKTLLEQGEIFPALAYIDASILCRRGTTVDLAWNKHARTTVELSDLGLSVAEVDLLIQQYETTSVPDMATHVFEFESGELVRVDGRSMDELLWRIPTHRPDATIIREFLESIGVCHLNVSREALPRGSHGRSMYRSLMTDMSWAVHTQRPKRSTGSIYHGVPLPHVASLALLLGDNGLVLDYRFGHLVVTNVELARSWKDETNVTSTSNMTLLDAVFEGDFGFGRQGGQFGPLETLGDIAKQWQEKLRMVDPQSGLLLEFQPPSLAQRASKWPIAHYKSVRRNGYYWYSNSMSFRDALGIVLSENEMRCHLSGEVIYIHE